MMSVILAMMLLSAMMLAGCALTPIFEDCPFKEGQSLNLKEEVERAEGWNGPPSMGPTRTHFLFKEEGVLKTKRVGFSAREVSSLEAERDVFSYQLCEGAWLRINIQFSGGGVFSSGDAWVLAEYFNSD